MPEQTLAVQAAKVADWAERQATPPVTNKPNYDRLTRTDIGLLLKLHKDGLTQTEIAKRLGCNQPTVSKWLDDLTDSRPVAKEYLAGQSLRLARNIVNKGRAQDHVKVLEGLGVLESHAGQGQVTVQIGIGLDQAKRITFASETQQVSQDIHSLTDAHESDK